jgi:hypothetical protein
VHQLYLINQNQHIKSWHVFYLIFLHFLIDGTFPPADAWCRISLGTPQEMAFVAKTLHDFRAKGWG